MAKEMTWLPSPKSAKKVLQHPYASFIHKVQKPARYLGGEYNSNIKNWEEVTSKMVLCFPDVYDIGMSHLGTKILYSIVNKTEDLCLERAFCPWDDMEQELEARQLPLLSLENHKPLSDFDVVGFSLQYEMTFSNVLTMMHLGGVPLLNKDRTLEHPLVIAGGPVATQPEPLSPFIDAFLVGDAEERLPRLMRHYQELKDSGQYTRTEILIELAKEGGLYCPDLYEREICPESHMLVVSKPLFAGVPEFVERAFLEDISRYQFPDNSPVAVAEAIFDRMSIEISRGCTEGCRFCQAGMIYRPVRERDPDEIIDTLISALDKGGYDEASITSLSTADYSCVSPLIKKLMEKLRERKTSLGISSLRAYGLSEDLLDEIDSVKATGLTFAPEAGTQRMRDVVNKNVSEEDIFTTCHRVFSRGWSKMKFYFMIGLPTETTEDIEGIAKLAKASMDIGKKYKQSAQVTVSVSSHIPKPHTPFQWCRMDRMDEIVEKQEILYQYKKIYKYKFRKHDMRISHLEGILARGDQRTGSLILKAWEKGARFDGWDECLKWDLWMEALEEWETEHQISRELFLDTIPVDARLPWDHIDMGLDEGFLKAEYQKALKDRLSPPCGKPKGAQVHHTNVLESEEDERKLVCYHCGIACDLSNMKTERIQFLTQLNSFTPPEKWVDSESYRKVAQERIDQGHSPHQFDQGEKFRFRLQYTKKSPIHLQGHHDMLRIIPRVLRRANLSVYFSEGYTPRPVLIFGPALSLGIQSLSEFVEVALTEPIGEREALERLNRVAPNGLEFLSAKQLNKEDLSLAHALKQSQYAVWIPTEIKQQLIEKHQLTNQLELFQWIQKQGQKITQSAEFPYTVIRKDKRRVLNLQEQIEEVSVYESQGEWVDYGFPSDATIVQLHLAQIHSTMIRPLEAIQALFGIELDFHHILRVQCWSKTETGQLSHPNHFTEELATSSPLQL